MIDCFVFCSGEDEIEDEEYQKLLVEHQVLLLEEEELLAIGKLISLSFREGLVLYRWRLLLKF